MSNVSHSKTTPSSRRRHLAGPRGKLEQRFEADVTWDSDKSKWVLNKLVQYRNGEPRPTELLDTEELNTQKLNDLKTALAGTKIVGVMRKPTGLGADLKAGTEIMKNEESLLSLMNRGFYPVSAQRQRTGNPCRQRRSARRPERRRRIRAAVR